MRGLDLARCIRSWWRDANGEAPDWDRLADAVPLSRAFTHGVFMAVMDHLRRFLGYELVYRRERALRLAEGFALFCRSRPCPASASSPIGCRRISRTERIGCTGSTDAVYEQDRPPGLPPGLGGNTAIYNFAADGAGSCGSARHGGRAFPCRRAAGWCGRWSMAEPRKWICACRRMDPEREGGRKNSRRLAFLKEMNTVLVGNAVPGRYGGGGEHAWRADQVVGEVGLGFS